VPSRPDVDLSSVFRQFLTSQRIRARKPKGNTIALHCFYFHRKHCSLNPMMLRVISALIFDFWKYASTEPRLVQCFARMILVHSLERVRRHTHHRSPLPVQTVRTTSLRIHSTIVSKAHELSHCQKFTGRLTTIVVPRPDAVRTFSCAPIFSARARMLENPNPSLLAA
jgi:hypothetical protein